MTSGFNLKVLRGEDRRNHHPSTSWSGRLLTTVHQPTQNMWEKQMGVKIMILFSSPYESEEQSLAWVTCTSFERLWHFHFALAAQETRAVYMSRIFWLQAKRRWSGRRGTVKGLLGFLWYTHCEYYQKIFPTCYSLYFSKSRTFSLKY